jgi:DnaJ domain
MMKINSKLFDRIRIKPRHAETPRAEVPQCGWEGCPLPGPYRAPKSHRSTGEYHNFCLEHVRHYNQAFNYFADATEDKIEEMLRRAAATGERPTWGMGANAHGHGNPKPRQKRARDFSAKRFADPHNLFARLARNQGRNPITERERRILEADRRALETLGLDGRKTSPEIKAAYKSLVKKHHPDANGGDRSSEDRLRTIIAAYTHLKTKGFV